ncbi:MAG: hypothetical protein BroJett030_10540 [Alphaproteobacteria bacterium]|nr:MAG: hypothetical protein BroJett030_10540 [Alphaproteobacteria bacterium]
MSMGLLIIGLVIFLGAHSVRMVAPDFRAGMIARLGEGPWKGLYALASLIGLILLVWGYGRAQPLAPVLYVPPFWLVHLVILLMAFAFIALAVSLLPSGRLRPLLKHPMLLATKTWAIAHLLVNGDLASVLLFGAFLAWAGLNRVSVGRRGGAPPVAGPVRNDVVAVVVGILVWLAFIWKLHEWVAGVPVPLAA